LRADDFQQSAQCYSAAMDVAYSNHLRHRVGQALQPAFAVFVRLESLTYVQGSDCRGLVG
jgi:hypothetical protein